MDNTQWKPPYLAAVGVFALVLAGYVLTLAPTVTFWDAGELIAAVHTLGIPHPPGTPLFVLLGHVWSMLFPLGEVAWRLNLMSATFSAAGAAFFFLVVHYTLVRVTADIAEPQRNWLALGGAAGAAVIGAFTFTNWQNSIETEAYSVATFTIAAICWASFLWRHERAGGGGREARWLMLIVYLAGISMGNHLLALLSGPELSLEPVEEVGVTRVGENQLPSFVANLLTMAVAHTFKYIDTGPLLSVNTVAPERKQGRFDAQVDTLVSLGDVTLRGAATVEIDVKSGTLQDLRLTLPANINVLGVSGPSLRNYEVVANTDDPASEGQVIEL